jgi:hypothetical protein
VAKYRVLEKSYIGGRIVEAGEVVDHEFFPDKDGKVGASTNLEALEPEVKARKAKKAADSAPAGDGSDLT